MSALATGSAGLRAMPGMPVGFVVERGLDEGALFSAEAQRQGAVVSGAGSDLATYWMFDLEPRLKRRVSAIAGFTGAGPLFCLEVLARDYGLRPICRIEHRNLGRGGIVHSVEGLAPREDWQAALTVAGERWPAVAAALIGTLQPRRDLAGAALPGLHVDHRRTQRSIFTWMLAPDSVRRALLAAN